VELLVPSLDRLPAYVDALQRGWSPDTERDEAREEELAEIRQSPQAFVKKLDDPQAEGPPVRLPDGSHVPRLPSVHRWMWDGEFAGTVGLRWTPGSVELPPTCLGHMGYTVVPWKRGLGYAKAAVALMLPHARALALPYVEIVTNVSNVASQHVVLAIGGPLVERFQKGPQYGGTHALRFRIAL